LSPEPETGRDPKSGQLLSGIRILDFTHVLSGPFATMMLGDLGAEVIKVERLPGGDETRQQMNMLTDDVSIQFAMVNRNKKSVAVDASRPEGLALLRELIRGADAFIENWRPGTMAKLGLGPEDVRAVNPECVYCSVSGFGQTGPLAQRGGFDLIAQGMSGMISVTGDPDGGPVKIGPPVADLVSGIYAALGIVSALLGRERSGRGERIDVSLLDSALSLMVWESAELWGAHKVPRPHGIAHRNRAPYEAFLAADGWFLVGAGNEPNWRALCTALELPDLVDDPRFARNRDRVANVDELRAILSEIFAGGTAQEWVDKLAGAGCPSGPILDMQQVFDNEQVQARQMQIEYDLPPVGPISNIGFPLKIEGAKAQVTRGVPRLGEHTAQVLRDLCGVSTGDLAKLHESGVVFAHGIEA
jgi:crotonobetainyl-CoA:carnitine CoA-transferase CaiB-like acyl-CoA transferase